MCMLLNENALYKLLVHCTTYNANQILQFTHDTIPLIPPTTKLIVTSSF